MAGADGVPPDPYPRTLIEGGRSHVVVKGLRRRRLSDFYHWMLTVSWARFFGLMLGVYVGVNLVFGGLYWLSGGLAGARRGSFADAFFFSVQTLGTIGYGAMTPRSLAANLLVTGEAFVSIALTAIATGLIFARVSRPTARVVFSRFALVNIFEGRPTLMFRAGNVRANQILEAQVTLTYAHQVETPEGVGYRRFETLRTVRSSSPLFALSWTVMHVIDEASPLHQRERESLLAEHGELIVVISGVDETFAQRIHARHAYLPHEIVWGRRFADVLSTAADGRRTIDYARFHDLAEV